MGQSLKLLFVVNDPSFFLSHRLPIALAARDSDYEVFIVTPYSEIAHKIESAGLTHIPWSLSRSGTQPLHEIKSIILLAKILRKIRPDIIHLVTIKPVLYGGALARLLGIPAMVAAISGMGYLFANENSSKGVKKWLLKQTYRFALNHPNCKIIVQNNDDKQSLDSMGALQAEHTVLIKGSGVDLNQFTATALPDSDPLVVLPARMLWDKGVGIFVEAAKILAAKNFYVRMALVGPCDSDSPNGVSLRQLQTWNEQNIVEWWGKQDDMPTVLSTAHLVALPSFYREGMPKSLLEAAAAGRAIVTTDSTGCRDVIEHGVSGLLIPSKNAMALADAIKEMLQNRAKLEQMGQQARLKAESEFSIETTIEKHMEIYNALCPN